MARIAIHNIQSHPFTLSHCCLAMWQNHRKSLAFSSAVSIIIEPIYQFAKGVDGSNYWQMSAANGENW
jgi:hypothetical protein